MQCHIVAAGRGGALISHKELVRLEGRLARFPTAADEDAQLLAGRGALVLCCLRQQPCSVCSACLEPAQLLIFGVGCCTALYLTVRHDPTGGAAGYYLWTTGGARLDGPLERMFVKYRMQRKRALSRAIAALRDALSTSTAEL